MKVWSLPRAAPVADSGAADKHSPGNAFLQEKLTRTLHNHASELGVTHTS